jgi:hypothetical protein
MEACKGPRSATQMQGKQPARAVMCRALGAKADCLRVLNDVWSHLGARLRQVLRLRPNRTRAGC